MRLKAPNFTMPGWLDKVLMVVVTILFSPIIAGVASLVCLFWIKRQIVGPRREWGKWFAWHPVTVHFDNHRPFGGKELRWLEFVERKSWGVMADTCYRKPGSTWEKESW